MVPPSPFDRLLQEATRQASKDASEAFANIEVLYGKCLTGEDVLKLGAFAVHLGCAGLGRFKETEAFQRRLLAHPSAEGDSRAIGSLLRGLAVVLRLQNRNEEADDAVAKGVTTSSERCRLAVLTAQTFAARGRFLEAANHLKEAEPLLASLDPLEDIVSQGAQIATGLARAAEGQARQATELLHAATRAIVATTAQQDWRARHAALYQRGRAHLVAGEPTGTLDVVQRMMSLEDANQAGPLERFFTASLACRAQVVRGMAKVAGAALEACRDYAGRSDDNDTVLKALADLEAFASGRTA